jgi:hypothetical protein
MDAPAFSQPIDEMPLKKSDDHGLVATDSAHHLRLPTPTDVDDQSVQLITVDSNPS